MKLSKTYDPKKSEGQIYKQWEKANIFKAKPNSKKQPFSIIMPPPNANGMLHLGHAVFVALEDIMTRYQRMKGKEALWLPGLDHAGFETQVVFEKELAKKGKSRFDYSRKQLYQMMWKFTQQNKKRVESQLRQLGASCDWSREKFTLDPDVIKTVYQTFKKLYDDKLVYRGQRVVNWCPHHQTSFSDLEVAYEPRKTKLWYIKYPLAKNKQEYITVATTRPETMLGDTAVAINPDDKRYKNLIGKTVALPLMNREIPIIADKRIDIEFGTGAVKITPAHDSLDFEISQTHKLKVIKVINEDAKIAKQGGKYAGLKVLEAREKIIEDLKKLNLLEKEEDYKHSVGVCYKCKTIIEPMTSEQWFIKIDPLAKKAIEAVKKGKIKFVPEHYKKIYFNWMKNIKDWNISRQIVWGIQMPIWHCHDCKEIIISIDKKPFACPKCKSKKLKQETDTFDTWFSSGQWPFITLGYPKSKDFKYFYPTDVMETGWDILFFWVARMIMLGLYVTDDIPFRYVYLHGLVRDKDRQKMSKSKGNVIDPLGVVDLYGADALRMALVFGAGPGKDIIISEEKIIGQRKFTNKIWNAARFILSNFDKNFKPNKIQKKDLQLTKEDRWILNELKKTTKTVSQAIDKFNFHQAAEEVYHFFWHKFCDKTIENTKQRIREPKNIKEKQTAQWVLWRVLLDSLKLMHPFMPFITENIYQQLPAKEKKFIAISDWPK